MEKPTFTITIPKFNEIELDEINKRKFKILLKKFLDRIYRIKKVTQANIEDDIIYSIAYSCAFEAIVSPYEKRKTKDGKEIKILFLEEDETGKIIEMCEQVVNESEKNKE